MGQKVNPIGLRLGINRTWDSRWFAGRDYAALLHEDLNLRRYLTKRLSQRTKLALLRASCARVRAS